MFVAVSIIKDCIGDPPLLIGSVQVDRADMDGYVSAVLVVHEELKFVGAPGTDKGASGVDEE